MSSGIVFQNVDYNCSSGMAEYLLQICVQEFPELDGHENYPHIGEFFSDYLKSFFSGLIIFLDDDAFKVRNDYVFLSKLFKRVFDFAEGGQSELSDSGKSKITITFRKLEIELERFCST